MTGGYNKAAVYLNYLTKKVDQKFVSVTTKSLLMTIMTRQSAFLRTAKNFDKIFQRVASVEFYCTGFSKVYLLFKIYERTKFK